MKQLFLVKNQSVINSISIDECIEKINNLKVNGPVKALSKDDVIIRSMIILGEEETSHKISHYEGVVNGKEIRNLSEMAKGLPGAPMMEGHRFDKIPWGRIFMAEVTDEPGYTGKVLKIKYYFMNDAEGKTRAKAIDAGILSEGSISYQFKDMACNICHEICKGFSFFGMSFWKNSCAHEIGKEYNSVIASRYPVSILSVLEVSFVYRGSYPKTKQIPENKMSLGVEESAEFVESLKSLGYDNEKINRILTQLEKNPDEIKFEEITPASAEPTPAPAPAEPEPKPAEPAPAEPKPEDKKDEPKAEPVPAETQAKSTGGWKHCVCPKCGYSEEKVAGDPCREKKCPKCGTLLEGRNEKPASFSEPVTCKGCGEKINYSSVPESAPGAVRCPKCDLLINQLGEVVGPKSIKIGSPVGPLKPYKSGTTNNEFFDKEGFRDLEGMFYVEPKYDGVWMELHKDGDKVFIFSDEGNDHTEKFPGIVADAQAERGQKFIIAGEMVKYRGRQRLTHEDVSGYIHSKGPYEDQHFRLKVFDIMLAGDQDLRNEPLSKRRAKLDSSVSNTDQIHLTKFKTVDTGDEIIKAIDDLSSREGAMVKSADSTYTVDGSKETYKWKRQYEVDVKVIDKKNREGGGFVYTCEVGRGDEKQTIGETYTTTVEASTGDILQVSVDHITKDESGKYTWYAPKVLMKRTDKKEPDPLSTLARIAQKKGVGEPEKMSNVITLGEIVPALKSMNRDWSIWLVGGLVEKGFTTNDIDIVTNFELSDEQKNLIRSSLLERYRSRVDFVFDVMGPVGPNIELVADMGEANLAAWKHGNKFVLQKHWWGDKVHYDLRFGAPKTPRMWGWTLFSELSQTSNGKKTMCQEKGYHDPKWMDYEGDMKPGEIGNPTKNHMAHMRILDKGSYIFVKREPDFMEVILDGSKYKGRYVWRKIQVKGKIDPYHQGEDSPKEQSIWIIWRPKDQTTGGTVKNIAYKWDSNYSCYIFWETE